MVDQVHGFDALRLPRAGWRRTGTWGRSCCGSAKTEGAPEPRSLPLCIDEGFF